MTGVKTNERPGTRAVARYVRISPSKVRVVLDLVRGKHVSLAEDILRLCERDAATPVGKLLLSAIANAENNDGIDPEELFVSACFADEGPTLKRNKFRARGRATRILKRTCHITIVVSRLPEEELRRFRARQAADQADRRARRVAGGRRGQRNQEQVGADEAEVEAAVAEQNELTEAPGTDEAAVAEATEITDEETGTDGAAVAEATKITAEETAADEAAVAEANDIEGSDAQAEESAEADADADAVEGTDEEGEQ
ncbi:MAG: 50S ribosomal protein L22 [Acidimicrobiales bacterium]